MEGSIGPSLEARLDLVESRIAIEEILAAYAHGFDHERPDLLRSIWHEDAKLDLGDRLGSFHGVDGVMAAATGFWGQMAWMNHRVATPSIEISGDSATGVMGVDCMAEGKDKGPVAIAGTYFDAYERRDGVWKIASRRFVVDYFTPINDWKPKFGRVVRPPRTG